MTADLNALERMSAEELVRKGFCDVVRLFVKNEPHSEAKVRSRRFRLISSVSLVDQVVERVLFSIQNNHEIANWKTIPSKPGIGLDTDDQIAAIWNSVVGYLSKGQLAQSDVTGWDFAVKGWLLDAEAVMRVRLANCPIDSPFGVAVRARYVCMKRKVFYLSDGRMLAQRVDGIQPSGSYTTGSSNSRERVLVSRIVGASWAIAMGDDCLEKFLSHASERYAAIGFPLKDYRLCVDKFEFCSHEFVDEVTAIPVNWGKTLFRLLSKRYDADELSQFEHVVRAHPDALNKLWWVANRVGWGPENL